MVQELILPAGGVGFFRLVFGLLIVWCFLCLFFVLFCFVFMINFPFGLVPFIITVVPLQLARFLRIGFGGIDFLLSEHVRAVHTKQLIPELPRALRARAAEHHG